MATPTPPQQPPIALVADMRLSGMDPQEIRRATAALRRLARGAYIDLAEGGRVQTHLERARAVQELHPGEMVASHQTAAAAWGLPLLPTVPDLVHMTSLVDYPANGRRRAGFHLHRAELEDDQTDVRDGLRTTEAARTVIDCARTLSLAESLVIADAALATGVASIGRLREELARAARRWGIGRARRIVAIASPLAESPGESLLRLDLLRAAIDVEEQVVVPLDDGTVARIDFVVRGTMVAVEFDGRSKYTADGDVEAAHWREKRRHDRLVELGYEVLHITWSDLGNPSQLRRRIDRARARALRRCA